MALKLAVSAHVVTIIIFVVVNSILNVDAPVSPATLATEGAVLVLVLSICGLVSGFRRRFRVKSEDPSHERALANVAICMSLLGILLFLGLCYFSLLVSSAGFFRGP